MNQTIIVKHALTASSEPVTLAVGELAVNHLSDPPKVWVGTPTGPVRLFEAEAIEDAADDSVYGRSDGEWVPVPVVEAAMPSDPAPNTLWLDSATGRLYLWFKERWVEIAANGVAGPVGPRGPAGPTGAVGSTGAPGPQGSPSVITSEPPTGAVYGRLSTAGVGAAWVRAVEEGPADHQAYVRKDGEWVRLPPPPIEDDAPSDGGAYGRKGEAWSPIVTAKGNLPVGLTEPANIAVAHAAEGGQSLGWIYSANNFSNGYFDGTQWRQRADGYLQLMTMPRDSGTIRFMASTSAQPAGAVVTDLNENASINPNGDLSTRSSVVAGGNVVGTIVQARAGGYLQSLGQLHVNGRAYFNELLQIAGGHGIQYVWSSQWFSFHWGDPNVWCRVDGWLDVHIGTASDERMKQDIEPSTLDCLAAISRVPLYEYRWRDVSGVENIEDLERRPRAARSDAPVIPVGFVAQRSQEAFPESVLTGGNTLNIDVNAMLATLTGAIQQLTARVQQLEAERDGRSH